ncbi:hypothetical protein HB370_25340 [Streptomyces sp. DSM 40868]|nr:hypothetical protein HB370_25340 [Streptomyces sp. DSM 40868]
MVEPSGHRRGEREGQQRTERAGPSAKSHERSLWGLEWVFPCDVRSRTSGGRSWDSLWARCAGWRSWWGSGMHRSSTRTGA